MNLYIQGLLKKQAVLDAFIIKKQGLEGQDLFPNTVLALLVELGEMTNDWQGFKHWKVDTTPKPGLGEEYADVLHFLLSIGNQIGVHAYDFTNVAPYYTGNVTSQISQLFLQFSRFLEMRVVTENAEGHFTSALETLLGLGDMLGYDLEQIQNMYIDKWAKNIQRQFAGY